MKEVFTAKTLQAFLASGKTEADLPANAILTPSARDLIRTQARQNGVASSSPASAPACRLWLKPPSCVKAMSHSQTASLKGA